VCTAQNQIWECSNSVSRESQQQAQCRDRHRAANRQLSGFGSNGGQAAPRPGVGDWMADIRSYQPIFLDLRMVDIVFTGGAGVNLPPGGRSWEMTPAAA